jgi:hypothetical protein
MVKTARVSVILILIAGVLPAVVSVGCSTVAPQEPRADVVTEEGRIFIVDRTAKRWDVTHAVRNYGFVASQFQFGLGPNAIRPILDPEMLSAGDPGYPTSDQTFLVIGTTVAGESRAYRIDHLNGHEVVDETFVDVHVAVGW